jgi:transcriptional regulator with XRE-family HTH domain
MSDQEKQGKYELLEALLKERGFSLKGAYTNRDVAQLFGVSPRTIQEWSRNGDLRRRSLPGRFRFLSADLETFLQNSLASRENPASRDSSNLFSIAPKARISRRTSS